MLLIFQKKMTDCDHAEYLGCSNFGFKRCSFSHSDDVTPAIHGVTDQQRSNRNTYSTVK